MARGKRLVTPAQPAQARAGTYPKQLELDISQKQGLALINQGEELFTVDGVLTAAEAAKLIVAADACGFQLQSSRGAAHGEAFRDNYRLAFEDAEQAALLWQRSGLEAACRDLPLAGRRAIGLNPNLRLYKYVVGQRFGRHFDDSVELGQGRITAFTLLVYLSGGEAPGSPTRLVGGETVFYGARGKLVASVEPRAGRALLHRHGDACLAHEGHAVRSGVKYVLRSDVVTAEL
ncbi:hypothetical protein WJX81_006427 [Elliptochloris bilobata]|uniref:Prolyl 4-hydroxylase alpha subunit domain-containing protein n=1 Tax=Elliptochloris bilobata TaxID=381761 RepID=A0AAW1S486_9CHLO